MNLGVIEEKIKPNDLCSGGLTLGSRTIIVGGQWDNYLPVVEFQNNNGYDRLACLSYSLNNCIETFLYVLEKRETNNSDRFLAKMSGTTKLGNYFSKVANSVANDGAVAETVWPDSAENWEEYYKKIPNEIKEKAKDFNKKYDFRWEWVRTDDKDGIMKALEETPLQVQVRYASGDGILHPLDNKGHGVMVYGYVKGKYWKIFDHYTQTRKKYAWDYVFGAILKPIITINDNYIYMKFKQNRLYLLVEGKEQKLAMYLDGVLVHFPDWSIARENSNARIGKWYPPISTSLRDWESVDHTNSKGEKITQ